MSTPDYMLDKPPGPSAAKAFLDQRIIPAAIDLAGDCEVALHRASKRTGLSVSVLLAGAAGVVGIGAWLLWRTSDRRPRR